MDELVVLSSTTVHTSRLSGWTCRGRVKEDTTERSVRTFSSLLS